MVKTQLGRKSLRRGVRVLVQWPARTGIPADPWARLCYRGLRLRRLLPGPELRRHTDLLELYLTLAFRRSPGARAAASRTAT